MAFRDVEVYAALQGLRYIYCGDIINSIFYLKFLSQGVLCIQQGQQSFMRCAQEYASFFVKCYTTTDLRVNGTSLNRFCRKTNKIKVFCC